ncbi:MAG: tetratricopeptide repeat protein [Deinococcota bacterium]|nr:tetratricopeptide repeat protein [Deinococcota bacterium]
MMLRTLGDLSLEDTPFRRPKPLLLLAYLALEGPTSRRTLAELFFGNVDDPRDSLSTALRRLRSVAPCPVEADEHRLWAVVSCDASELLTLLYRRNLEEALHLYQGTFLEGFSLSLNEELEAWVYETREYLAGKVREARLKLGEDAAAEGRDETAAQHAEIAFTLAGAPELEPDDFSRVYRLLQVGKSPKAAEVMREADAYGLELHAQPTKRLAQLPLDPFQKPSLPNNLPTLATSFVGRETELLAIDKLHNRPHCRLLTLHGPGGVGKTKLAMQAAHHQLRPGRFEDGVFFAGLESLSSPEQIPLAVAEALGLALQGPAEPLAQVKNHIGEKHLLLVLDNYEHLMDGAGLSADLINACPNLRVVITSRERLNVHEEHAMSLEGLPLPAEDASLEELGHVDALQLFLRRAKKSRLDFRLTEEDLPHALKICYLVQGYPLGIELAAAWVRMMPLKDIATEIERNMDFLATSTRNVPGRQQSIRATFEYSWRLLTPRKQEVLRKLSVFHGGFRKEAASEVAGATFPTLVSLVDKSLLRTSSAGRFDWHPLLRQFMEEKLIEHQEEEETQNKHAEYFLALAEDAEPQLVGDQQGDWLTRLEAEHDNLRAALAWGERSKRHELALRLAGALWRFWQARGYLSEGRGWLAKALSQAGMATTAARAKALNGAGMLAWFQGDYSAARSHFEESLAIRREVGDKQGIAASLSNLASIDYQQGGYVLPPSRFEESLAIRREAGDKQGIANSLGNLGIVALDQGDFTSAHLLHEESLAIRREVGDKRAIAFSLYGLAQVAHAQGDDAKAYALFEESLAIRQEVDDRTGMADSLNRLGLVALDRGEHAKARALVKESLALFRVLGDKRGIACSLEAFAVLRVMEGEPEQAPRLWGAAEALRETIRLPLLSSDRSRYERSVSVARAQLDEERFRIAWARGRVMMLEQIIVYALEEGDHT